MAPRPLPTRRYHFISGLPRSGSTLLSAILRQNPRFAAGISSPLCGLLTASINVMSGEGASLIGEEQRANVLRGLFDSWARHLPDETVVFDTNRNWTAKLPALLHLYPDAKVVCLVRNVAAVMDSIERVLRANPLLATRLFSDDERANVYTRTEALSQRNRLVGGPWTNLKEAFYGPDASSLLVIDYDYLARAPAKVIELLYSFLGEAPFAHDFDNIQFDEPDFDEELRLPGLHKVQPKVEFTPRATTLPHDLFERFSAQSFWTEAVPSRANLVIPNANVTSMAQAPASSSSLTPPPGDRSHSK